MNVNGVTSTDAYAASYTAAKPTTDTNNTANTTTASDAANSGVVYEPSNEQATTTAYSKKISKADPELVAKLQADAEAKTSQLRSLVEQLLTKQGKTFSIANDMYSILASGKLEVDPATRAQAQADIAEDGYWGVEQTSDRIVDFAIALSGGSSEDMDDMLEAFKKGYKQAEKTWGGELPEISQKTYDAVIKKFEDYQASLTEGNTSQV